MISKPLAVKSTIGLLGVGGASFGAYEGYKALTKEEVPKKITIADKIKESKYELLTDKSENSNHWTNILASYKDIVTTKGELKFDDFDGSDTASDSPTALAKLKQKCSETLTKDNNDQLLNKVKKWCVIPISIDDLLKKQGITPLKTNAGQAEEEKTQWEARINSYRKFKKENPSAEVLIDNLQDSQITPQNIVAIKAKCEGFSKIVSHHKDFEATIDKFKPWCTTNG